MSKRDFHKEFKRLKAEAIEELKDRLKEKGGEYLFSDDSCPIVCAYVYDHPDDYKVTSMELQEFCGVYQIILNGYIVSDYGSETEQIFIADVEDSHIPYIWDYMD